MIIFGIDFRKDVKATCKLWFLATILIGLKILRERNTLVTEMLADYDRLTSMRDEITIRKSSTFQLFRR